MEQNLPLIAKKAWSLMRAMFFMLKKGISKTKFLADLNIMMKRGKLAGKALHNLLFHHHHNWAAATFHRHHLPSGEYEFSCRSTPLDSLSLFSIQKKHQNNRVSSTNYNVPLTVLDSDDMIIDDAVLKVLGMLTSATTSPALSGFGSSPMVEQMKITDSPFPLSHGGVDDSHVDEAAEKFIRRFYDDRKREN